MASVAAVMASLRASMQIISGFRDFVKSWIEAPSEIREFLYRATEVESRIDSWQEVIRRTNDGRINKELARVSNEFEDQVRKLMNKCNQYTSTGGGRGSNQIGKLAFRGRVTVFPGTILKAVNLVEKGLESILKGLECDEKFAEAVFDRTWTQETYFTDEKYVPPCERFVLRVRMQLEQQTPGIVCLYGAAGMGKSMFARHLATVYQSEARLTSNHPFPGGVMRLKFSHNVLQESNEGARTELIVEKLKEFLTLLGKKNVVETNPHLLRRQLSFILQKQTARRLIILDNLPHSGVLSDLLPGESFLQVKYLITSRFPVNSYQLLATQVQLPSGVEIEAQQPSTDVIPMQVFSKEDGMKILIRHAGLKDVPDNCKDVIEDIVLSTSVNPLALAYLGMALQRRNDRLESWKELKMELEENLDIYDEKTPTEAQVFFEGYGRSVRETLTLVFDSVKSPAQALMLTVAMFEGASVELDLVKHIFETYSRRTNQRWRFSSYMRVLNTMGILEYEDQKYNQGVSNMNIQRQVAEGQVERVSIYGLYQLFLLNSTSLRIDIEKIIEASSHPSQDSVPNLSTEVVGQRSCGRELEGQAYPGNCDDCLSLAVYSIYGEKKYVASKARTEFRRTSSASRQSDAQHVGSWIAPVISLISGFNDQGLQVNGQGSESHCDVPKIPLTFKELKEAQKMPSTTHDRRNDLTTCRLILKTCRTILTTLRRNKHFTLVWTPMRIDIKSFESLAEFIQSNQGLKGLIEHVLRHLLDTNEIRNTITDRLALEELEKLLGDIGRQDVNNSEYWGSVSQALRDTDLKLCLANHSLNPSKI